MLKAECRFPHLTRRTRAAYKIPRPDRLLPLVLLALGAWAAAQEDHPSAIRIEKHIYDSDYDSWTGPYREMPLLSYWYDPETRIRGTDPAKLKVVVVEGDDQPPSNAPPLQATRRMLEYRDRAQWSGRQPWTATIDPCAIDPRIW